MLLPPQLLSLSLWPAYPMIQPDLYPKVISSGAPDYTLFGVKLKTKKPRIGSFLTLMEYV